MKRVALLMATTLLAGCATVDRVAGEQALISPDLPSAPDTWLAAGVAGEMPTGDWLSQFADPMMTALVEEALNANPTLEAQLASVEAATAQARSVYGRTLPNVNASASAGGTSNAIELGGNLDRVTDSTFGLGLDVSWEADLWGRLRNSINASEADLAASEADLAALRLAIAAQTSIAWINLNNALAQERVAVETYEARDQIETLTERRFGRGLSTALDVRLSRSAKAGAEATIAARRQSSGEAARRLEILLRRYPSAEIEALADLPSLPPIGAGGNPVMLLSRRPDVAAAEARIKAAGFRAEQARLALMPSLRLTGSVSNSAIDFEDVIDPERIAARLIASLAQPIFNGGALKADRDAAAARARAASANYVNTALTAWREVEDAIAADALLAQQEDAQTRSRDEAVFAEDLAQRQYANGLISIFNLIDAQTRRLNAQSNLIQARANRATNRVGYHLALGGGVPLPKSALEAALENPAPDIVDIQNQ